jgi:hypothetical protein
MTPHKKGFEDPFKTHAVAIPHETRADTGGGVASRARNAIEQQIQLPLQDRPFVKHRTRDAFLEANNGSVPLSQLQQNGKFSEVAPKREVPIHDGTSHHQAKSEHDRVMEDALWNVRYGFDEVKVSYQRRVALDEAEVRRWNMLKAVESSGAYKSLIGSSHKSSKSSASRVDVATANIEPAMSEATSSSFILPDRPKEKDNKRTSSQRYRRSRHWGHGGRKGAGGASEQQSKPSSSRTDGESANRESAWNDDIPPPFVLPDRPKEKANKQFTSQKSVGRTTRPRSPGGHQIRKTGGANPGHSGK